MRATPARALAVLLVAALVVLGGCATGDTGTTTGPTTNGTTGGTTTATTATRTTGTGTTGTGTATTPGPGPNATQDRIRDRNQAALRNVTSYTVHYALAGFPVGNGSAQIQTTTLQGTERVNTTTRERAATINASMQGMNYTIQYYRPPNASVVYQNVQGNVQQIPARNAYFVTPENPGAVTRSSAWPNLTRDGTAETDLGTADRYVATSVDQLPAEVRDAYGNVTNVSIEILVDRDTGLVAAYHYELDVVQDGQPQHLRFSYRLSHVNETTVEKPDWAP